MLIPKENLEYWALIAEVVGSIGVIASVIYLGVQVGGSTNELQAQTHYNAISIANRQFELLMVNAELANIVTVGSDDPEKLSRAERERFTSYHLASFAAWEHTYYLNKPGSVVRPFWEGHDEYMKVMVKTKPGLRKFWVEYRHGYAEPFRGHVDAAFP